MPLYNLQRDTVTFLRSVLRKCGIVAIPARPNLPSEIWLMIFDLLIEPTASSYKHCTHDTFPVYRMENGHYPGSRYYYQKMELPVKNDAWCRIVLVCHAWAGIVGPRPRHFTTDGIHNLPTGVRSVTFSYMGPESHTLDKGIKPPSIARHLTDLCIKQLPYRQTNNPYEGWETLLEEPRVFPMLRSLRVQCSSGRRTPNLWYQLEKAFPDLISLALYDCVLPTRTVTFKALEILMIHSRDTTMGEPEATLRLKLPCLKHCEIQTTRANTRAFFAAHGHQLQSLTIILHDLWLKSGADFWTLFPELLTLETVFSTAKALRPPPSSHPLQRLVLLQVPQENLEEEIRRMLRIFITIRHLSISQSVLDTSQQNSLRSLVRREGARDVDFSSYALLGRASPCPPSAAAEQATDLAIYGLKLLAVYLFMGGYSVFVGCLFLLKQLWTRAHKGSIL